MKNKFVFVSGHHRSGTSLLHRLLRSHNDVSGFLDTGVPEDEGQHLQKTYKPTKDFGGAGRYIFNSDSYMNENHPLATENAATEIFQAWSQYFDLSKDVLIEKSPPNLIRTRFLQHIFPKSKFVVILRHPLAVSYATQKWSKTSIQNLLEHTLRGYEIFLKDLPYLKNVYVLRYEDFVRTPQVFFRDILDFIEIPPMELSEEIRPDVNEKYFDMWEKYTGSLSYKINARKYNQFEIRANIFGYSIKKYDEALLKSTVYGKYNI